MREAIDVPLRPFIRNSYDQLVADTRSALDEEEFSDGWAQGRSMTFERVIAFSLD